MVRALESLGFVRVSQSGSHLKLRHADGRIIVIPMHSGRDMKLGLLRRLIQQAGVTVEEFMHRL